MCYFTLFEEKMMKEESSFGFDGEQVPCIPNYNVGSIREEGKLTELYVALAKARSEFDEVVFDSTNPHFQSRYVTLGAIQRATVPALTKNGLLIIQLPITKNNGQCLLVTKLVHTSGAKIEFDFWVPPTAKTPHAYGSAITYSKRYCQIALLNIFGEDGDDDGNLASSSKPNKATTKNSNNKNKNNDLQTQADEMASGIDDRLAMVESQSDLQKLLKELTAWRTKFSETNNAITRIDQWTVLVNELKEQYE